MIGADIGYRYIFYLNMNLIISQEVAGTLLFSTVKMYIWLRVPCEGLEKTGERDLRFVNRILKEDLRIVVKWETHVIWGKKHAKGEMWGMRFA